MMHGQQNVKKSRFGFVTGVFISAPRLGGGGGGNMPDGREEAYRHGVVGGFRTLEPRRRSLQLCQPSAARLMFCSRG
jgi:hypothetical protein